MEKFLTGHPEDVLKEFCQLVKATGRLVVDVAELTTVEMKGSPRTMLALDLDGAAPEPAQAVPQQLEMETQPSRPAMPPVEPEQKVQPDRSFTDFCRLLLLDIRELSDRKGRQNPVPYRLEAFVRHHRLEWGRVKDMLATLEAQKTIHLGTKARNKEEPRVILVELLDRPLTRRLDLKKKRDAMGWSQKDVLDRIKGKYNVEISKALMSSLEVGEDTGSCRAEDYERMFLGIWEAAGNK
jgi:hypothetical protein